MCVYVHIYIYIYIYICLCIETPRLCRHVVLPHLRRLRRRVHNKPSFMNKFKQKNTEIPCTHLNTNPTTFASP